MALGRPNGLRNADNDLTLSETGTEVHAISQVFTGAIYDILADIFAHDRKPGLRDDANCMLALAHADAKPVAYRNFIRNRFSVREVVVSPTPLTADLDATKQLQAMYQEPAGVQQDRRTCRGTMNLSEFCGGQMAEDEEATALKRLFEKSIAAEHFEIAVEDGARRHTVSFLDAEDTGPRSLRQLVAALVELDSQCVKK